MLTHSILLHNVFPYIIVAKKSPSYEFMKRELEIEDEVLYYNFTTGEEYIPKADIVSPPEDMVNNLEQDVWQMMENADKSAIQSINFVYDFILIFKRRTYQLLSNSIFCYKIINIDQNKNYTVSSIFDYPKYYRLVAEESGDDKEAFIKAFASTSLFSKFIEDSFDVFYRVYIRGETIDPHKSHLWRFLKNIINSYEVMPSAETKRQTFFKHNAFKVFSLLHVYQADMGRFEEYSSRLKCRDINLEDYFKFYIDKTSVKHSSFFYSDRKVAPGDQYLNTSITTTTVKSNRSNKSSSAYFGKYYFKPIKVNKLTNVMLKDLNESQIELKQMLDIFS